VATPRRRGVTRPASETSIPVGSAPRPAGSPVLHQTRGAPKRIGSGSELEHAAPCIALDALSASAKTELSQPRDPAQGAVEFGFELSIGRHRPQFIQRNPNGHSLLNRTPFSQGAWSSEHSADCSLECPFRIENVLHVTCPGWKLKTSSPVGHTNRCSNR